MIFRREEEQIRRYLLGESSPEERQQIEENMLRDDEFGERLLLCEDELIDDYARGALPASDRELFERNFRFSPARREKLLLAQAAMKYATANPASAEARSSEEGNLTGVSENITGVSQPAGPLNERPGREWWQTLFAPKWKVAAYAVFVLGVGLGIWQTWMGRSDVGTARAITRQVYSFQRPLEARITGFEYAAFPKLLGGKQGQFDYVALDRAERLLLDEVAKHATVEARHELGRLCLARKKFDQAQKLFEVALQSDPDNARLRGDLGVVLFEKWDREQSAGREIESEELKRKSIEFLKRALELDRSLLEARFNLALLYQASNETRLAREEWENYLRDDPASPWAKEAEQNLKVLR